jgi:hypothetical protein
MSQFRIDVARVHAAAESIRTEHDAVGRTATELERSVTAGRHGLPESYAEYARAYQDAVGANLISALYDYRSALDKVATALRASVDAYVAAEKANAARVSR